jgi:hypothetical protein
MAIDMLSIFIIVVGVIFVSIGFYDRFFRFKSRWFCDNLGWHDGNGSSHRFDGCSLTSVCSRCGKQVLQDSQGNWF